jgi:hypothetical protein
MGSWVQVAAAARIWWKKSAEGGMLETEGGMLLIEVSSVVFVEYPIGTVSVYNRCNGTVLVYNRSNHFTGSWVQEVAA